MSILLTDKEYKALRALEDPGYKKLEAALLRRSLKRSRTAGLGDEETTTEWYYHVCEYLSDGAMAYSLTGNEQIGRWVKAMTMDLISKTEEEWIGPWYRDHLTKPSLGHLETAHLSIAVVAAADLGADLFSKDELESIKSFLKNRAMPLCLNWLNFAERLNNWRCILSGGLAFCAAYLDDKEMMERACVEFNICIQQFQPDGTSAESLQYGNYAAWGLMMVYEALVRKDPSFQDRMAPERYGRKVKWDAYSHLYNKPLSGFGSYDRPRAVNFNDCASTYRPTGDMLLHISARCGESMPVEAALASSLFDLHYSNIENLDLAPHDLATFGLYNDFGFLSFPLYLEKAKAKDLKECGWESDMYFSNGDMIIRESFDSPTVLAIRSSGEELYGPSHIHADLNHFMLVYGKERFLADPGHSCYRNTIHELDIATAFHNTCTFLVPDAKFDNQKDVRQEDMFKLKILSQDASLLRGFSNGKPEPPVKRPGGKLFQERRGKTFVYTSEAAGVYGAPLTKFKRTWILCGTQMLYVVDDIAGDSPVKTIWNWQFNNRDGALDFTVDTPFSFTAYRGDSGMRMFHCSEDAGLMGPYYAHIHDFYHPYPAQEAEGKSGSGQLYRWTEKSAKTSRRRVHAIALAPAGEAADWSLKIKGNEYSLLEKGVVRSSLQLLVDSMMFKWDDEEWSLQQPLF
jgi:hypothetical protein